MFTVELPYDIGTFVKVVKPAFEREKSAYCGTVAAYTVARDGCAVWVSGYKEPITGEYLPEELELMTEKEIEELIEKYGE